MSLIWWRTTPSALRAFLGAARFEVVAEALLEERPFMGDLVARPVDKARCSHQFSYYRERWEARKDGVPRPPSEDLYEGTGRGFI